MPQGIARAFPQFNCRHVSTLPTSAFAVEVIVAETPVEAGLDLTTMGTFEECQKG